MGSYCSNNDVWLVVLWLLLHASTYRLYVCYVLQADNAALQSRISSLQDNLEAAQAAAATAEAQLSRSQALLVQRSAEVGSAQGITAQLEEAQAQLGVYKLKLTAAELEVRV